MIAWLELVFHFCGGGGGVVVHVLHCDSKQPPSVSSKGPRRTVGLRAQSDPGDGSGIGQDVTSAATDDDDAEMAWSVPAVRLYETNPAVVT